MYIWLRFYLTRERLAVYLACAFSLALIATLPVGLRLGPAGWEFVDAPSAQQAQTIWHNGGRYFLAVQLLVLLLCAADLGSTAVKDYDDRSGLDFLLTRPMPRTKIILTACWTGVAQFGAVALLAAGTALMCLANLSGIWQPKQVLVGSGTAMLFAMTAFSIGLLVTAWRGRARDGFIASMAVPVALCLHLGWSSPVGKVASVLAFLTAPSSAPLAFTLLIMVMLTAAPAAMVTFRNREL